MELKDIWQQQDNRSLSNQEIASSLRKQSKHPIHTLQRNLLISIGFTVFFLIAFSALFFYVHEVLIQVLLVVIILFYLAGTVFTYKEWQYNRRILFSDEPVKAALQAIVKRIRRSLRTSERVAIFIYPVSIAAGFLLGFSEEKELTLLLEEPLGIGILLVTIILGTPASNWLAKWMNKKAYGKYLSQLEEQIHDMK